MALGLARGWPTRRTRDVRQGRGDGACGGVTRGGRRWTRAAARPEERRDGGFNSYDRNSFNDNNRRRDFDRNDDNNNDNRWSEDLSWNRDNFAYDDETSANYNDSSSFYDDLIGTLEDESWREVPQGKPMDLTDDNISMELDALNEQIRRNREEGEREEEEVVIAPPPRGSSSADEEDHQKLFAKMEALEFDDEDDEEGGVGSGAFNDVDDDDDDDFYDDLWEDDEDDDEED